MDYTVVWSRDALDDIDALAEYIARDSVFYAQQVVITIMESGDTPTTPGSTMDNQLLLQEQVLSNNSSATTGSNQLGQGDEQVEK